MNPFDAYPSRIDHGAVEHNPLDRINADRYRAQDEYEPTTPGRTADPDPALAEWLHTLHNEAERLMEKHARWTA